MDNKKGKIVSIALVAFMLLTLVAGCTRQQAEETDTPEMQQTVTITNSSGKEVEVPKSPKRVVVLYSQIPIAMKAIGVDINDRIVGLSEYAADHYNMLFPELTKKPKVGPNHFEVDYEKLIDLEPQIIMTTPFSVKRLELEEKLKSTDIKVVALDFDLECFQETVQTLGEIFNKEERATEYANFWLSQLEVVEERVSELSPDEKVRCYGEGTQQPYKTVSSGASLHEVMELAGGMNIAADLETRSPEVDPEWVIEQNPEVIFKYPMGAEYQGGFGHTEVEPFSDMRSEIRGRTGLTEVEAVKEDNIYILSRDIAAGAFENIGVLYVAKILYPELFEDIDPEAQLKEMVEKYLGLDFENLKGIFVYPCLWRNE
ncbi:MAG: ABC transporter substrate-binding protein [Dehalococcoidia bacterium]